MSGGMPAVLVTLLRAKPSYCMASCPSGMLRVVLLPDSLTIHALVCVTSAGATQVSMVYSPEAWIMLANFALALVEACAAPPCPRLMPQPPTQVTLPESDRSASGLTPLVSYAMLP